MAEIRKMTMGEIAEVADIPKETARGRLKSSFGGTGGTYGWARFDVSSTVQIAVHAEMLRRVNVPEIAVKTANFIADSLDNFCLRPPHIIRRKGQLLGHYLIFRQIQFGPAGYPATWTERWCKSRDEALGEAGAFIADTDICVEGSGFYFQNLSTITDWALDRIFDLQGIVGNEAKAPQ